MSPPTPLPVVPTAIGRDEITGLQAPEIRRRLGEPSLIRREAPAEVWQYRTDACILDLYLYADSGAVSVVHAEARTPAAEPLPAEACFGLIAPSPLQSL